MSSFTFWKFLLACNVLAILLPGLCRAEPPGSRAHILVQARNTPQMINRDLLGHNVLFAGNGMWDTRIHDLETEAAILIKRLSPSVLRFPGGSIADLYIWEDGLGEITTAPIDPSTRNITLLAAPSWPGVTRIRLIDRQGGKYGDLGSFLFQKGTSLKGVKGFKHSHPPGASLRPELRPGQISWHSNSYGIIEHLHLCESLQAQPVLTVNYGSGVLKNGVVSSTASRSQKINRAAAWVAFVNGNPEDNRPLGVDEDSHNWHTVGYWAQKRVALGHPLPYAVQYWEIGNEIYNRHEIGHSSARAYGADFVQFVQAMKWVDPHIKIGAVGVADPNGRGDSDYDPWNATVLNITRDYLDFLIVPLYYPSSSGHPVPYHSQTWFAAVMGAASQALAHLQEIRSMMHKSCDRASEIKLIISEYGLWPADSHYGQDYANLARALYDADLLISLFKHGQKIGVDLAMAWNLHGNNPTAAIRFDFTSESRVVRPQFFVYELLQRYLGHAMIPAQVTSPSLITPRVGNVGPIEDIPSLQILATLNTTGRLTLWVLNRSLDQKLTTAVTLKHYQPRPKALVRSLHGVSPAAHNEAHPCQVTVQTKELQGVGPTFQYAFPAHSLTLIEFEELGPAN